MMAVRVTYPINLEQAMGLFNWFGMLVSLG